MLCAVLAGGILNLGLAFHVQAGPGDYDLMFGFLGTSTDHVEGRKPRKIAISLSNVTNKPEDAPATRADTKLRSQQQQSVTTKE